MGSLSYFGTVWDIQNVPFDNIFVYAEGLDIIRLSSLTDASVTQSHKNDFSNSNMATTTINVFFPIPYFS